MCLIWALKNKNSNLLLVQTCTVNFKNIPYSRHFSLSFTYKHDFRSVKWIFCKTLVRVKIIRNSVFSVVMQTGTTEFSAYNDRLYVVVVAYVWLRECTIFSFVCMRQHSADANVANRIFHIFARNVESLFHYTEEQRCWNVLWRSLHNPTLQQHCHHCQHCRYGREQFKPLVAGSLSKILDSYFTYFAFTMVFISFFPRESCYCIFPIVYLSLF